MAGRLSRWALLWLGLGAATAAAADPCDPYRLVPADPAPGPQGPGFLLEVARPDRPSSFLFGTYHSADPRLRARWDGVALLLAAARPRLVVVERRLEDDGAGADPRVLPAGMTLAAELADQPGLYQRVLDSARDYGLPLAALERARSWFAAAWLSQAPAARFPENRVILDVFLQQTAAALAIPIRPLETLASLGMLYQTAFDRGQQQRLLWEAVCNRSINEQAIVEQTQAYLADDVQALYQAASRFQASDPALGERLLQVFVTQRNAAFWAKLAPELEQGGVFVAVGALHLFGEGGLLERLATGDGFAVRRIDPAALTLTLEAGEIPALTAWVERWARGQGISVPAQPFAAVRIGHRPAAVLRERLCPGRPCRVEGTYLPETEDILLTDDLFAAMLAGAASGETYVQDGRLHRRPGPVAASSGDAYAASLVIRELVRHLLLQGGAGGTDRCARGRALHRASLAQQRYLREQRSPRTAHVFPLDARC